MLTTMRFKSGEDGGKETVMVGGASRGNDWTDREEEKEERERGRRSEGDGSGGRRENRNKGGEMETEEEGEIIGTREERYRRRRGEK